MADALALAAVSHGEHAVHSRVARADWSGHTETLHEAQCSCGWFVSEPDAASRDAAVWQHLLEDAA